MNRKSRIDMISRDFILAKTWFHEDDLISRDILSWWHDFDRFRFCFDPISWDFVFLCWPDFTMLTRFHVTYSHDDPISLDFVFMLTRFHENSFLCWPDFTMLTWFHEIYSRHHRNFDFCYNLAPHWAVHRVHNGLVQWSYWYRAVLVDLLYQVISDDPTSKYQLQSHWVNMVM